MFGFFKKKSTSNTKNTIKKETTKASVFKDFYDDGVEKYSVELDKEQRKLYESLCNINAFNSDFIELNQNIKTMSKAEMWRHKERQEEIENLVRTHSYLDTMIELSNLVFNNCYIETDEEEGLKFDALKIWLIKDYRGFLDDLLVFCTSTQYDTRIIFPTIFNTIEHNLDVMFRIHSKSTHRIVYPTDNKTQDRAKLLDDYFKNTPFIDFINSKGTFLIPHKTRLEHTHIVGGTGHGKTQLISTLIHEDIKNAINRKEGFAVIDGQGDLINSILKLRYFDPDVKNSLYDDVIIIDPSDIDNPISFNIFDIDFTGFTERNKEEVVNQSVELYRYIFGSLMENDLTAKQDTLFRFALRMVVLMPNSNIFTLRELLAEQPEKNDVRNSKFYPFIKTLDLVALSFFTDLFYKGGADGFNSTKAQVINRLLGVLAMPTLSRILASKSNKINLFDAMNKGKIVLIHTSKDFLQPTESTLFGRLFIAMFNQAALMRSQINEDDRKPFFLYIDECQDYLDNYAEHLFNQSRKYRLGLIVAHQNTDQLDDKLKETINASTSIKFVGGTNYKDSSGLAKEMRTSTEFIQDMRKEDKQTSFACYVKNQTKQAIQINVKFGPFNKTPKMSLEVYNQLLELNNAKYGQSEKTDTLDISDIPNISDIKECDKGPVGHPLETEDTAFELGKHSPL